MQVVCENSSGYDGVDIESAGQLPCTGGWQFRTTTARQRLIEGKAIYVSAAIQRLNQERHMTSTTEAADFIYSEFGGDPDMADLVELYVDEMPEKIATFQELAASKDWDSIRRIAHQIKGSAGGYGFQPITEGAFRLEHAVREESGEAEILEALDELLGMCSRLRCGSNP